MSWQALDWACGLRLGDSNRKTVLLVLAKYSDRDTETCFISQRRIAEVSELSESTVRRALRWLDDAGYIERRRRHRSSDGSRSTDHIRLCLPVSLTGRQGVLPVTQTGPTGQSLNAHIPSSLPTDLHLASTHVERSLGFDDQQQMAGDLARRLREGGLNGDRG